MADGDPGSPGNQTTATNQAQQTTAVNTQTQTAQTTSPSFTVDDGFIASLSEDLRGEPSLQTIKGKGAADVVKGYINAQKMIGGDRFVIPSGKNDTPEVWNAALAKLGLPETADGYKLERPQLPDGMAFDDRWEAGIKKLFHQAGLPNRSAQILYTAMVQGLATGQKAQQDAAAAETQKATQALEKDWGKNFDYNLGLAQKVIDTYGGKPEEIQAFKEQFGNNPVALRILANIGTLIGEGNFVKGQAPAFTYTPDEAKSKAMDIMSNKQNPLYEAYHTKGHIRHNEAVDEVERLFVVAKGIVPVDKR